MNNNNNNNNNNTCKSVTIYKLNDRAVRHKTPHYIPSVQAHTSHHPNKIPS